jgi:hypothetical protein
MVLFYGLSYETARCHCLSMNDGVRFKSGSTPFVVVGACGYGVWVKQAGRHHQAIDINHKNKKIDLWRRLWDSNPRDALTPNGFQDRRIRPLCQISVSPLYCGPRDSANRQKYLKLPKSLACAFQKKPSALCSF